MGKRWAKTLLAMAIGAMPLVTTATCDPRTGAFFFDRFDEDDYFFDGGGFIDGFFSDGCCGYYDDVFIFDGFYY